MKAEHLPHPYPKLDLIEPALKLEMKPNGLHTWDPLRKKWILLTPEEWVRQHVQHWLLTQTGYPATLLSAERLVKNRKRADLVGFDRSGDPILLVECKAPDVEIDAKTAQQATLYHQTLNISFLWLTNGRVHWVFQFDSTKNQWKKLPFLPDFENILLTRSSPF
jgi:hypothetical protein